MYAGIWMASLIGFLGGGAAGFVLNKCIRIPFGSRYALLLLAGMIVGLAVMILGMCLELYVVATIGIFSLQMSYIWIQARALDLQFPDLPNESSEKPKQQ